MLVTLTATADGEVPAKERKPSWAPAIAVTSGYTAAAQDASVSSTIDSTGAPLRPSKDDSDWHVAPYVGINAELMTPELPLPGGIRLFVNGEYLPTFATKLDVAKEGVGTHLVPSGRQLPDPFPSGPCPIPIAGPGGRLTAANCGCPFGTGCFPENAINGQGSRTTAEMTRDFFGAAVGVAVPFELSGRRLMIKPSFGWARFEFDIEGAALRGIKPQLNSAGAIPQFRDVPIYRLIDLRDSTRKAWNAIGPGLELEMEVHQAGPIDTTLFIDAHGYRILGDRTVRLSDSTTQRCMPSQFQLKVESDRPVASFLCNAPAFFGSQPTQYSAEWEYKINPWFYRAGIGLRFRWVGE